MLGVFSTCVSDGVNKYLRFTQNLTNEGVEVIPSDAIVGLIPYFLLVLVPAEHGGILKEGDGKRYPILTFGTSKSKVVLTLLEEVIAL